MPHCVKLSFTLALATILWLAIRPMTILAADNFCVRVDMQSSTVLYHSYDVSTNTLSSSMIEGDDIYIDGADISPTGQSIVMIFTKLTDSGSTTTRLRFIDPTTQNFHDVVLENSTAANWDDHSWSPDEQYFAFPIIRGDDNTTSLMVFSQDGSTVVTVPYSPYSESTKWAWSPTSDHVVLIETLNAQDGYYAFVTIASMTGEIIKAFTKEVIQPTPYWSPDGRYIALADEYEGALYVADVTALAEMTASQIYMDSPSRVGNTVSKSFYDQPNSSVDVLWTPDSQNLLYMTSAETDDDHSVILRRHLMDKGRGVDLAQINYFDYFTSTESASTAQRYLFVKSDQEGGSQVILIDGMTGTTQELGQYVFEEMVGAEWSPTHDVVWLASVNGGLLVRPETDLIIPLTGYSESLSWSPGGEWLGMLLSTSEGLTVWIINTQTGDKRQIPGEEWATSIIFNKDGDALIKEDLTLSLVSKDSSEKVLLTTNLGPLQEENGPSFLPLWSPDGQTFAFVERLPEEDGYTLNLAQKNGTPLSSVKIPQGEDFITAIQWVPCS